MYLKNLTVFGFKSFADKISLNFQPGATCIVGPNGCGKSNVSDSIRWVLGEQSAKALRGGEMADVIFNGTDNRKPMGMAEVSLTVGGIDGEHLKAAGVEVAYNEVTVTRRVYRDGGSEYFINKIACRLKDIQQLFMGTGMGRTSYSIMAQGNITQILSSRPEDRRMVFEEAAGITKFKGQKKESLRKLEATEQNLLRVSDLIREVKRQIGSLQRQAGKARRYKQIQLELQHLETQLARHDFDELLVQIRERETATAKFKEEIDIGNETVLRLENELAQLRERQAVMEQEIHAEQQRGLELKNQVERHEGRIHFNDEKLRELETTNSKALGDIAQAEERRSAAEAELHDVTERLNVSTAALQQHREVLRQRLAAVQAVETEMRGRQEALRQAQGQAFGAAQQLTRVRNEINSLEMQKQGNQIRLEKLSAEKIQLEEEKVRLESRLNEFQQNVEAEKQTVQSQRGTLEERQQRLRELQQELVAATQKQDVFLREQAEKRSRLNVLEQLMAEHQGFSAGAVAALKQSQHVLGSFVDKIRVPDKYVAAVELALGHNLQLVLTHEPGAAQQILNDLRDQKRGRASIAALVLQGQQAQPPALPEGFVGTLAGSVVEADDLVRPLVAGLLGQTVIVETLEAAILGWQATAGAFDFVTLSGEILTRQGVFTGGYLNGSTKAPTSILGRKNQIAELKTQLAELQTQINDASRHKGLLQGEQTTLQASLQEAQTTLRAQEVAMATRQGELNALRNSHRLLVQKIETVGFEVQNLAGQENEGQVKRAALQTRFEEFEATEARTTQQVNELNQALEELRQRRDQANVILTETKVSVASEEQLVNSLRNQKSPLEQRIRELHQLAEQRKHEISGVFEKKAQATREIEQSRLQIDSLKQQREQVSAQITDRMGERDTLVGQLGNQDEALRDRRRVVTEMQATKSQMEVELAQKQMSVSNLKERIQQKYQLNLQDIRSECITITIAEEGPSQVQVLTPEEMAASGAATDWNVVGEQVLSLQQRIDEIGAVNLVAIEEYEETEQRFKFLTEQHDDLVKGKEQLLEVINKINAQTKEMFVTTFNQIRDNFRSMFTEMFGGGKADLKLADEGEVLESGIEIMARPPGKQLQSITLLSGGEQTMTAVALLFSIYQVKPSPFCVLDELDAPLDESNINRFIKVLQRFLTLSQFIIITHNKRTIGMADALYGVTMEDQGVSKVVSVKFHKTEDGPHGRGGNPVLVAATPEAAPVEKADSGEVSMAK